MKPNYIIWIKYVMKPKKRFVNQVFYEVNEDIINRSTNETLGNLLNRMFHKTQIKIVNLAIYEIQ